MSDHREVSPEDCAENGNPPPAENAPLCPSDEYVLGSYPGKQYPPGFLAGVVALMVSFSPVIASMLMRVLPPPFVMTVLLMITLTAPMVSIALAVYALFRKGRRGSLGWIPILALTVSLATLGLIAIAIYSFDLSHD